MAQCYVVDIGQIDLEQCVAESVTTDCRTLRPRRPLLTAYKAVLYAVDKGLRGQNLPRLVVIDSATHV